jgi:hypothetical protein
VADPAPLSVANLTELATDPGWVDADPETRQVLLVDLADPQVPDSSGMARLSGWLLAQPVPIIGVGVEGASKLETAVDLVLSPGAELDRALVSIQRNPEASAVLVQVLRSTESLDVASALTVESLAYATLQAGEEFGRWLTQRRAGEPARSVPPRQDMVLLDREGDELRIVLNSPETRNSLSVAMRDALVDAFKLVAMDPDIGSVRVSANGPCFSAGGELEEFGLLSNPAAAHRTRMLRMPARYLVGHAGRYHFRVHRACIGAGIELPAFAGHLSAAPSTFFQLPEIGMGLIPGAGGCVSIPRRIGRRRTAYMAILNKKIHQRACRPVASRGPGLPQNAQIRQAARLDGSGRVR